MSTLIQAIDGPIISTSDLERMTALYGVFGLEVVAENQLGAEDVKALWGVDDRTARSVLLETPGTEVGVNLVQFDPTSTITIRDGAKGEDCNSLKVMDFVVVDFEQATRELEKRGFRLEGKPAEYEIEGEGRFGEAQIHGPDSVICVLLKMYDAASRIKFVKITDRLFSEIMGFTAILEETEPVISFYTDALGLKIVYEFGFETDTYSNIVGMEKITKIRGINFGLSLRDPMVCTIHYGLPKGSYRSLKERALMQNLGIVGIRFRVPSVAAVHEACREHGHTIAAGPSELRLEPYGPIRSLLVRGPHGVFHSFVEVVS
jgi:catechol 2,3-dioxygenase-like lactoylglutathione lyase family enzyme